MSFILDALKKIEQEKHRSDGSAGAETFAIARGGFSRNRQALSMGAIALASAAVTALALSTFSDDPDGGEAEPIAESASAMTLSEIVAGDESAEREQGALPAEPPADPDVRRTEATTEPEPEADPVSASSSSIPAPVVPEIEEPVVEETSVPARPAEEDPPVEEPVVEQAPEDEPVEVDEAAGSEPSAFRLVGRERAARGVLQEERPPEPVDEQTPPEDFPKLVLQGTSVIDGNAVAVISDQRVFVGDRIEGALVVRIEEREVELELDGRRFVLRL